MRSYLVVALQDIYKPAQDKKWLSIETLTKKGNPRHPLYMRRDSILYDFCIETYVDKLIALGEITKQDIHNLTNFQKNVPIVPKQ